MKRALLTAVIVLGIITPLKAETFIIHTALIPPYITEARGGNGHGVILEIISGALKAARLDYKIVDDVPWRRAQDVAIDEPNSLISPFARTAGREANWSWIANLLDEKMYIYTPVGMTNPSTVDELLKVKSLGVLAGGAPESVAKELGLEKVMETVSTEAQNAAKIKSGRLEAWMSQGLMASWGMRYAGIGQNEVNRAFVLRDLPLWVATSKKTSPENVEKLRTAFESFRTTPMYRDIISKY